MPICPQRHAETWKSFIRVRVDVHAVIFDAEGQGLEVIDDIQATPHAGVRALEISGRLRFRSSYAILCARGGRPDKLECPPKRREIKGEDVCADRRTKRRVTVQGHDLPPMHPEAIPNRPGTREEFE